MRLESWLAGLRTAWSSKAFAHRRVQRRVGRGFEPLETRLVLANPTVSSIVPDPSQVGTNFANPRFVVTFSASVTGVDAADFVAVPGPGVVLSLDPLGVTGSGTTYTVTVNGVSGVGTLGLNLVDNNSIRDGGGNGLVGNGNGTFQAAQNFAAGNGPYSMAVGDVNGDGRLDLAVAAYTSDRVSVLLGNGNGTFQAAQNFITGNGPVSVAVGDVNADGRLDLAVANRSSNSVSVLLGNGNGTFQAAQNFGTGLGPRSVTVGDVNGDGRLDLAVANRTSNTVSVLLGNGNGTFQTAQNFATGTRPYSVSMGDVNGDGRLDLAIANNSSNNVSVLLGNGNGTFQAAQNFATGASPRSVSVGDVNGDDRLDLAVANITSNTVSLLLGNGNGTFQTARNFATGSAPYSVAMGDVNGDGRMDLAVANNSSNTASVLLNAAKGNFIGQIRSVAVTAPSVVSIVPDPSQTGVNVANPQFVVTFSTSVTGVDAADFVAVPGTGVVVAPGPLGVTGSGTTYTVTVNGVSGVGTLGLNLVDDNSIGDLDGNGLVGNGTFQAAQNFATGSGPLFVAVGDVNGDGQLDLAVANRTSNSVSVLLGNGNGTFQAAQNFATGSNPYSVAVGDVNGDGRLDLAVANRTSNTVSVLLGNGNGTFQAAQNFATGNGPVSVTMGDVNADGRLDLTVANRDSNSVSLLVGNGNGTFQSAQNFATGASPRSVAMGDVNGDGRLDLAAANDTSATVSVLLGNGNGTFQAAQNFATGANPRSVAMGDVNGDGRLDLAVVNNGSNTVSVLLGNGNGTFQSAQNLATGASPRSVTVGDVNGDGRLDLAVANDSSATVSVLLGNGNGTFKAAQNFATGTSPRWVAMGDVNGDGRLDLAVANNSSNTVSVLLKAADGNFTGQTRTVDTVAPTVTSVLRQNPLAAVTGADQLTFRVTFSEAVQNVSVGDFALGGTSAADGSISSVTPVSTSVYDVLITGVTDSNGTIQLLFAVGQDIADLATNALTNTVPATSETYTVANNRAPTALALGNTSIQENVATGTAIGTFTTTDPDAANTFTYTLVTGTGSTDNAAFQIVGNELRTNAAIDFETQSSYAIRVRTTDQDGLTFEQTFTINVTDVNEQPTALNLSNATVAENVATGTAIGTFTSTDPDAANTFTYSLVTGTGSTDNAAFQIVGNELQTNAAIDFETQPSYSIRVRTTDQDGLTFEQTFTISVNNVNEQPTALALSNATVAENVATGTGIGTFTTTDPDAANTFTYTLVTGTGSTDNAAFQIVGDELQTNAALDFETQSSYAIRVRTTDQDGLTFEQTFTISVTNVNEQPTALALSNATIAENTATGTGIGTLTTTDPDAANTFTYSLVAGTGSTDNAAFQIVGDELRTNAATDFETQSSYAIRVRTTDQDGLTFEQTFTITVTDVNEQPTALALSNATIAENLAGGTGVGTFSSTDPDAANTFTYSLVPGTGSTDNSSFQIVGNELQTNAAIDFETQSSFAIRVRTTDQDGLTFEQTFTISVTDVNEQPTALALSNATVAENVATGTGIGTFTTTDPDAANTFTYTLVTGTGSTDNAAFQIVDDELRTNAAIDFETQSSYSIRVRTTDQDGLTFEQTFTVSVSNVNEQPAALALSNATIAENVAVGTGVGTFTTTDPDAANTFTYSLVAGTGSTDNAAFTIVGDELQTNAALDFETQSSYAIRVRTTDQNGLTFEQTFSITVTDVNEQPTALALSNATVAENVATGTAIGTFSSTDPDAANSFTYLLVTGTGSTDNAAFQIVGNELRTNTALNFETKSSYSIRVGTTDQDGLTFEQTFTITVTNVNEHPTALALSNNIVAENVVSGTAIGTFSTTDPDGANTFTYSLVTGTGSTDNAAFQIVGSQLRTNAAINFETKSSYAIRVRTTDQGGLTFEQTFTITVTNVNEQPTALALSNATVAENVAVGTSVGTLSSTDPDAGNTFTFSLVTGTGSTDNSSFQIVGNDLRTNAALNFETKPSYAIRVRTTDQGGLTFEQTFTITVTNVNEQPTALALSNATVAENVAVGTGVGTFSSTDPDAGNTFTYSLVTGTGSTDNSSFQIVGNELRTNAAINFGTRSSYAIRVRTSDQGGLTFEQTFTITNVNERPTALNLSNALVAENVTTGSPIGTFTTTDPNAGNTFTYSLVTGTGSTDNAVFQIVGDQLRTNAAINFETKSSFAIRVRTTDQGGLTFEQAFTISVTNVNEQPTALALSNATVAESVATGTAIGTLTTTDPDAGNTFTYSLVTGTGSTDNAAFQIVGNQLRTNAALNFETKSSYAIRVRTTDQGGLTFEQAFTISVTNVNEAPTAVALQNATTSLPESASTASAIKIADIAVTDDALGTNALSLSGVDAAFFEIVGTALRLKARTVLNFETKAAYRVTVNVNDATVGATPDASTNFTLTVTNTNDAPVLDNSGSPFVVLGVGARQSLVMLQGVLVSDLLARGAAGDPINDEDAGALTGIAVTAIDRTYGTFQFTLVSSNPAESNWADIEAAGAISSTSALLLPANARLRFKTALVPHHEAGPQFLALESKLDAGLTFRAWDRTSGVAGGRANTTTNGGTTAFSTATETSRVYFEARRWRHFNRVAGLNVDTLEAEFTEIQRLANINNPDAFEDRSTDAFTGFSVLMSAVPELTTIPLYRLYFGVQFNDDGTQTDMGYRYLTTNLAEAEELEGNGPADKRATREGTYFRELGINRGTGILGYIFSTQQPGTSALTQIYRTDLVNKPTRPAGTSEGGTPTSFRPQEIGDHVYTTNVPFESARTGVWRTETLRGYARELSPNTSAVSTPVPATAASSRPATPRAALSYTAIVAPTVILSSLSPTALPNQWSSTSQQPTAGSSLSGSTQTGSASESELSVGLIAPPTTVQPPATTDTGNEQPETTTPPTVLTGEVDANTTATDDLFTTLGSTTGDLCPW